MTSIFLAMPKKRTMARQTLFLIKFQYMLLSCDCLISGPHKAVVAPAASCVHSEGHEPFFSANRSTNLSISTRAQDH